MLTLTINVESYDVNVTESGNGEADALLATSPFIGRDDYDHCRRNPRSS